MEDLNKIKRTIQIGFIGFGEAVTSIIEGLRESNDIHISVWYYRLHDGADKGKKAREKATQLNVSICESLEQLTNESDLIFNLTTSKAALSTADEIIPYLEPGKIYADLNSGGPDLKRKISEKLKEISVLFVDGAIMAPVPMNKHRVPILVSGNGSKKLKEALEPLGMRIEVIPSEAGGASAVKMVRSIFMKGLAAITIETYSIAQLQGEEVFNKVFESINETFITPYDQLTDRFILGTMKHAGRRAGEIEQAIQLFVKDGISPIMSLSTQTVLQEIATNKPGFEPTNILDTRIIDYFQIIFKESVVAKGE